MRTNTNDPAVWIRRPCHQRVLTARANQLANELVTALNRYTEAPSTGTMNCFGCRRVPPLPDLDWYDLRRNQGT